LEINPATNSPTPALKFSYPMDLNSVFCKYNLISFESFNHPGVTTCHLYSKQGAYCPDWFYKNFVRKLGSINKSELVSMSAEELEEFAVGCSVRSMGPEC